MKKIMQMQITAFIEKAEGLPLATQIFKTEGSKTQVIKDLAGVIDKIYPDGMGKGSICLTIREKN